MTSVPAGKGVVISVNKRTMVVMTDEGEFKRLHAPRSLPAPGDVIQMPAAAFVFRQMLAVASILLVLALSAGIPVLINPAVASVDIEVGGSLTLGLDDRGRVCSVKGLDPAGKKLAAAIPREEIEGRPATEAVGILVARAAAAGMLSADENNLVLVNPIKGKKNSPVTEDELRKAAAGALEKANLAGYLVVDSVEEKQAKNAHRKGYSAGRLTIDKKLKELRPEVPPPVTDEHLAGYLEKHAVSLEELFPQSGVFVGKKQGGTVVPSEPEKGRPALPPGLEKRNNKTKHIREKVNPIEGIPDPLQNNAGDDEGRPDSNNKQNQEQNQDQDQTGLEPPLDPPGPFKEKPWPGDASGHRGRH